MKIEIMGPGCPKCAATERNALEALEEVGVEAEVQHLYDVREYSRRGVMFTPALAVEGEVVVAGRVPTVEELKTLFRQLQGQESA